MSAGDSGGFSEPFTGRTGAEALGANLLLLHGLGAFPLLTWNGPSWSISCEFWTYILFGAVVLAVGRSMAIFGALALAAGAALLMLDPPTMNVTYDYGLLRCLYGFFVGAVVYAVYERMRPERVGGRAAFGLEAAAIAGALLFVVVAGDNRASLLAPLVFAAVTLAFACQGGACSRALGASGFRRMGQLSYGIYMLHAFAVYAILTGLKALQGMTGVALVKTEWHEGADALFIDLGSPLAMDIGAIAFVGLIVALAELSFRFIEEPGRHAGAAAMRWMAARTQPAAAE